MRLIVAVQTVIHTWLHTMVQTAIHTMSPTAIDMPISHVFVLLLREKGGRHC